MRRSLMVLCGLMALAAPLGAQQVVDKGAELREAVAPAPRLAEPAEAAPTLLPTQAQVAERVRQSETARAETGRRAGHGDYIYLIAAIVVGIVIAAVVLN